MKGTIKKSVRIKIGKEEIILSANYRREGKETLFFIHGLGCTKESFEDAFTHQSLADFSLIALDLPGFGSSSKPNGFTYAMEDLAEVCVLFLRKIKAKNIVVVAHSMGGSIGLLLAERFPEIIAFINVEGNLVGEDCGIYSRKTISVSFDEFKTAVFSNLRAKTAKSKSKSSQLWVQWSEKADPWAFYASAKSLVEWSDSGELLEKFKDLKIKKSYIFGDKNTRMEVLKKLKGIEKIKIAESGHFPMIDDPLGFYSVIFQWIRGTPTR